MTEAFCKLDKAILARRDLTASDKIVWAYIRDRVGGNGDCWPGLRTISKGCGLSINAIGRAAGRLERAGLIEIERGGPSSASHYRLAATTCIQNVCASKMNAPPKVIQGVSKMETEAPPKRIQIKTQQDPSKTAAARKGEKTVTWNEAEQRFDVTAEQLAHWTRDFPDKDVVAEVRKAGAWHGANRRWKSNFQAALTRWLARQANLPPAGEGRAKGRFKRAAADYSQYDAVTIRCEAQA